MESLGDFVERFRHDVQARCGCPVYKERKKSPLYHLRKDKERPREVFAHINQQKQRNRFRIEVKEKWANLAKVAGLACGRCKTCQFGGPGFLWYVTESNTEEYNKAVRAFTKICQVR